MNDNTANNQTNPVQNAPENQVAPQMPKMSKNKMLFALVGLFAILLIALSIMSLTNMNKQKMEMESTQMEDEQSMSTNRDDYVGIYNSKQDVVQEAYVDASYEVSALVLPRTLELKEDSTAVMTTTMTDATTVEYGNWSYDDVSTGIKIELIQMNDEPLDSPKILFMSMSSDKMQVIGTGYNKDDFIDDVLEFSRQQ